MSSQVEVFEDTSKIDITVEESTVDVHKTVQEVEITQTEAGLEIHEVSQDLEIQQAGSNVVELFPNAMLVQQFFSGDDATELNGTLVLTAGEALGGHKPVYVADGEVFAASNDTTAHIGKVLGVTTHAAAQGEDIRVKFSGPVDEAAWSWTPGPVYIGANGSLTQNRPANGWEMNIGVATHANRLVIMQKPALLLA